MKTLSIRQPWATLIVMGLKEFEFRTWKTKYRGEILIHASLGIDKKSMKKFEYLHLTYPLGVIVGSCNVTDCIKFNSNLAKKYLKKDKNVYHNLENHDLENDILYGWKLENIKKIDSNIKVKGQLGLWNYNKDN